MAWKRVKRQEEEKFHGTPDLMWESWQLLTDGRQFTIQNLHQLYVLVSSAQTTIHRDMTCTVLKATKKTNKEINTKANRIWWFKNGYGYNYT